jgi:hypothetical protein
MVAAVLVAEVLVAELITFDRSIIRVAGSCCETLDSQVQRFSIENKNLNMQKMAIPSA